MKRLIKFGSVGLVIVGAIASVGEVGAQGVPTISKLTSYASGTYTVNGTLIRVTGTPSTTKAIKVTGITSVKTTSIKTNACGFAKISNPSAYTEGDLTIEGGTVVNVASTKASSPIIEPTCLNGVAENLPATGSAFNVGKGAIVVKALPALRQLDLTYSSTEVSTKNVSINACGYGFSSRIPATSGFSVVSDGVTSAIADIPEGYSNFDCKNNTLLAFQDRSVLPSLYKDPLNNVFVKTTAFRAPVEVSLASAPYTKSVTSNRCQQVLLPADVSGAITVNGASVNLSSLTDFGALASSCTYDSGSASYGGSTLGKYNGRYLIGSGFQGVAIGDRQIMSVQYTAPKVVKATSNGCGIAKLPSTVTDAFSYGGTAYTVASLPVVSAVVCPVINNYTASNNVLAPLP